MSLADRLRRKADDYKALAEEHAGTRYAERLEIQELTLRELADAIDEAERERDAA